MFVRVGGRGGGTAAGTYASEQQVEEEIEQGASADPEAGGAEHLKSALVNDGWQAGEYEQG